MKRLICIATLLAWSSALAADGYLAISNNVMVIGPGGAGSDPNALTNNDSRAITLTNSANVFAGASFSVATQYVGTIILTNVDGSFWTNLTATNLTGTIPSGNLPALAYVSNNAGLGTNNTFTGATNYGSPARTNWTWMDTSGWWNTNNSAANQGVNITKGTVNADASVTAVTGQFNGNGAGITNAWVKDTIYGGLYNGNVGTGQKWGTVAGTLQMQGGNIPGTLSTVFAPAPIGGYLTNFQVTTSVAWGSGTNIVFTVQTNNTPLTTGAGSLITCTLSPAGGSPYTNSGTTSLVLPTTQSANGYVWAISLNTTSPGGTLIGPSLMWSIEWWHQLP